jgi:DNA-binding GntR family transcriptional regulator
MYYRKMTAKLSPVELSPVEQERALAAQIQVAQRTLRGQAYDILKRRLLAGELRPGERVNEVVMAAGLGISRGPLREAIRNLEQEGLLVSAPHRGTFVRTVTEEEAAELQEVRLALETAAACRLARRWSPDAKVQLEQRLNQLRALQDDDSTLIDRMSADLAFHEAICEASGNGTLLETWRSLIGRITMMSLSVGPQRMSQVQAASAHAPLLEAIASGDEEIIRETYARVFDEGSRLVLEAVRRAGGDTVDAS